MYCFVLICLAKLDTLSWSLYELSEKHMGKENCTFQVYRSVNARYSVEIGVCDF